MIFPLQADPFSARPFWPLRLPLCVLAGVFCLAGAPLLWSQALPTTGGSPGFELPSASGTVNYSLTVSDSVSLGYEGTNQTSNSANISAKIGYISSSVRQPSSLVYSGGYLAGTGGQQSSLVQNLGLSQVLQFKRFTVVLADSVSYLPSSRVSGLSGVPGLGDLGVSPVQVGPDNSTTLLSNYGARLTNNASASASYAVTGRTSVAVAGNQTLLRLPGGNSTTGVESDTDGGSASTSYRVNARTTISGNVLYSHFSYLSSPLTFDSQGVTAEVTRQWTPHLTTDLSIGPQNTSTSGEPNKLNYTIGASATYQLERTNLQANFGRSTNSGAGIALALRSNSVNVSAGRTFSRVSRASVFFAYTSSTSLDTPLLPVTAPFHSTVAGLQGSRTLGRNLSAYASYTLQRQASEGTLSVNALNGVSQSFGFGFTYSPRPIHLR